MNTVSHSTNSAAGILLVFSLAACNQSSPSPKYKYLSHGQTQIRIDEASGRTDRLTNNGWVPISFDSPSVDVPKEQLKRISTTITPGDIFDRIAGPLCYTVDNESNYVLKEIFVSLPVRKSKQTYSSGSKITDDVPLLL